jgi:alkyldihydroxyacetonephosphate synthase
VTKRKWWGWGVEGAGPSAEQGRAIARTVAERFGVAVDPRPPPRIEELALPAPRAEPPASLAAIVSDDPTERAGHHYGKSYRDVVRAFRRELPSPPDQVAFPRDEAEVTAVLDWCDADGIAVVPYGGGSSVVGGVETAIPGADKVVSLDLGRLDRVVEIDATSRAARIQAGVLGPALEDQLRPHGLTLRHFPQSFEFSTLGGWIATRSGGHYATLYTHIDDFVESLRVVTPAGLVASRRLPGSGAGPSPDRLFIGSEGILGVITEAWMRLQDRPRFRAGAAVRFRGEDGFLRGAECVRRLSQSGLFPSNCRLLDAQEALTSGAGDGSHAVLVLGFESADHPLDAWQTRALELCRDAGGEVPEPAGRPSPGQASGAAPAGDAAGAWRRAFLQAPYVRDVLVACSVIAETFETAIPWNRFPDFHAGVMQATRDAVTRVCGAGTVACRFTHVYPDGAAPYYSVLAPGRPGSELEQWAEIKAAASEAILAGGGTITHHHAVGRDHRSGYDRQRPDAFAEALRAAKRALDPRGRLNPGVLLDP